MKTKEEKIQVKRQPSLAGLPQKNYSSCHAPCYYGEAQIEAAQTPQRNDRYKKDKLANKSDYTGKRHKIVVRESVKTFDIKAQKTMIALMIMATAINDYKKGGIVNTLIKKKFTEFAKLLGATDKVSRYRLRKGFKDACDTLAKTQIIQLNAKGDTVWTSNIIATWWSLSETKQSIQVDLTPKFVEYASSHHFMLYNTKILTLDDRKPYLFHIANKLQHIASILERKTGERDAKISLTRLIEAVPDLPTLQEVKDKHGRHYKQLIIDPLIEGLNELKKQNILEYWYILNPKSKPLEDKQLDDPDYESLKDCVIHYAMTKPQPLLSF